MSVIMSIASSIATGIQDYYSLQAQQKQYEAEASRARYESALDADKVAARGRRIQASAIARAGAGGVSDSPSALDVLVDNAQQIADDISAVRYQGAVSERAMREGAKMAGWAARMRLYIGLGEGAGKAAAGYMDYKYKSQQPPATQRAWFSNEEYDWGQKPEWSGWGSDLNAGGDYGGNASTASRGDL